MITITLKNVTQIALGMWQTVLHPSDVRRFGNNASSLGNRSVLAVTSPHFDKTANTMSIALDGVSALNVGRGSDVVLVDLDYGTEALENMGFHKEIVVSDVDQAFVEACKVHLPPDMVAIISTVLSEVRKQYTDKLVEGVGRKWTADPNNFLAITIQNRNQQFLISVRADPTRHILKHVHLKRSRAPYCEFHLNSPTQIDETVRLILASAKY